MNIKTIVKVMNFHALLRVERAHREADRYARLEKEVVHMIDLIQNNRNFILDKRSLTAPKNAPHLRIYIGSDMGFCGAVNSYVNSVLSEENGQNDVIVIGRKIHTHVPVLLQIDRDDFAARYDEISKIVAQAVHTRKYSGIEVYYDHYYNMTHIEPTVKTIFPVEISSDREESYTEDFYFEGSIDDLMEELIATYINYEIKIASVNAFASENILRQSATNDSLKRIDEMEQAALWEERKVKNQLAAKKIIDFYSKTKLKPKA